MDTAERTIPRTVSLGGERLHQTTGKHGWWEKDDGTKMEKVHVKVQGEGIKKSLMGAISTSRWSGSPGM
jgi:pyridoxine 5'-phosphate synthase PdxJ